MRKYILCLASVLCLALTMPSLADAYEGDMVQAVKKGKENRVKSLLKRGVHPDTSDEFGDRPLIAAVRHSNIPLIRLLLSSGANVNKRGRRGETALIEAAQRGHEQIVKILLNHRADKNRRDQRGKTARDYAVERGHRHIVHMLGGGGHVQQTDLLHAASNGNTERVKKLLERGYRVNMQDSRGFTALMYAANNGHLETVKVLLRHGANKNITDRHGRNALYYARSAGHLRIARLLDDYRGHGGGAYNDPTSVRIFMEAARTGNIPVAEAHLRARRVTINVRNPNGKTALDIAIAHKQKEMVRFLMRHGAK